MKSQQTAEEDNGSEDPDIRMDNPPTEAALLARDKKDESAESSSTGSSEGKSGSGGGYSADCSASDQSSDENGDRKETIPALNLNVQNLKLHDRAASRSSDSSDDAEQSDRREGGGSVEEDNGGVEDDGDGDGDGGASTNHGKGHDSGESNSLGIDLPLKSPDTIDLESIVRSKTEEELANAAVLKDQRVLPQWNGVRIAHPMDPRIDLSTVTVLQADVVPGAFQPISEMHSSAGDPRHTTDDNTAPFSVESYSRLMEVIRPFFQSHGVGWQHQVSNEIDNHHMNESSSDQVESSEGFTSFFTTTNSGANSGGTTNSGSPQSSDLDKKPPATNHGKAEKGNDAGDDSSMAVLARVKRKHKKVEDSGNSASSSEKRVRVQERKEEDRATEQLDEEREADANGNSSGSSSLTNVPNQEGQQEQQPAPQPQAPLHISVPPRIVTDVSSSKTSSATSSNPATSSGSGSGGNTGSGSNHGSSGSGNEGKASSEEPVQGDNSGESPVDESDQPAYKNKAQATGQAPEYVTKQKGDKESRLLDKKRKRIEMRREYEAQQQMESSESGDSAASIGKPGRPVTMDQVLQFSKVPRIVMQASPPFLVVHTNAAFARMTGVDSHQAVGQPISSLVFLPEASQHQPTQQPTEDGSNPHGSDLSSAERHPRIPSGAFELERLIAGCGHGKMQILKVVTRNQVVGRSVTISKDPHVSDQHDGSAGEKDDFGRNEGRQPSHRSGGFRKTCRASIAPIVSGASYMPKAAAVSDREAEPPKSKRRKSHSHEAEPSSSSPLTPNRPPSPSKEHKKHPMKLIVTHYIIQLEDISLKSAKDMSMESISSNNSTSVEARLVGLSKEQLKQQKLATVAAEDHQVTQDPVEDEGAGSESTVVPEHVSAMG